MALTDRTTAEDRMESGTRVGFRMKSSEYILIANGAITPRTVQRRLVSERWANPEEIISVWSGYGTDLGTGKKRQFDPWESGVNATPNWTKHPSPSRLLKQDRRRECT